MLKLRTDVAYVKPDGKLTQAGVEAIQGQLDANASTATVAALDARVTTLEGYARRVLLATRTASASATLDFTEFNNAVFRTYQFDLVNVKPATDAVSLLFRTSTNGGSSYDAGASDYTYSGFALGVGGALAAIGSNGASSILLTFANDAGNAAAERGVTGGLTLFGAPDAAQARITFEGGYDNTVTITVMSQMHGVRRADQDTDAVRFLFSSGNIASGTIRMYGLT